jgi:hypothetical protein
MLCYCADSNSDPSDAAAIVDGQERSGGSNAIQLMGISSTIQGN